MTTVPVDGRVLDLFCVSTEIYCWLVGGLEHFLFSHILIDFHIFQRC